MRAFRQFRVFFRENKTTILVVMGVGFLVVLVAFGLSNMGGVNKNMTLTQISTQLLVAVVNAFIFAFVLHKMSFRFAAKKRSAVDAGKVNIRMAEVIGNEQAKREAWEVVELLRDRVKLKQMGGKILKGILFCGPPGCGKTLLAKAIATESGIPFIPAAGSDFSGMLMGLGVSKIKQLFEDARRLTYTHGYCIVFIDEFDAVAHRRSFGSGANQTAEQDMNATINQLLIEMDGVEGGFDKILVIGATNAPEDVLDPALIRPGRFDRKIYIGLPNLEEREALFKFYLAKVKCDPKVDIGRLARRAVGKSPADITNVTQEAALIAMRGKRNVVNMKDLMEAMERVDLGVAKPLSMTSREREFVAYRQAGYVIACYYLNLSEDVFKASLIPRGTSATSFHIYTNPREEYHSRSQEQLYAQVKVCVAGFAAERLKYGTSTTAVEEPLAEATKIAHSMVWMYGMNPGKGKAGQVQPEDGNLIRKYGANADGWLGNLAAIPPGERSYETQSELNQRVKTVLSEAMVEVDRLLRREWTLVEEIASELLKKQELDYDEIEAIFRAHGKTREDVQQEKEQKNKVARAHQVTFADVIGNEEAKREAKEVVQLIRDRVALGSEGGHLIKGLLLSGVPGCGKTLLARAIATESALPFLAAAGSDFVEKYVGVGASRIRQLFRDAREMVHTHGGCIIFIDELDVVATRRTFGDSGSKEHDMTLNALLVEMDGLASGNDNVVVIGATNAPEEVLDPALLRAGRFDRKIYIGRPSLKDREEVFRYYLAKASVDPAMDIPRLARRAVGYSPALISSVVKEAAMIAARKKLQFLTAKEIAEAMERIELGVARPISMTRAELEATAYHEVGHLMVVYCLHPPDDVFKASIIPKGAALGVVHHIPREEIYAPDRNHLLGQIKIAVAGYVSEKIKYGTTTTGVSSDFAKATALANDMIWKYGMGGDGWIGDFTAIADEQVSPEMKAALNRQVRDLLNQALREVEEFLRKEWRIVEYFVKELLEKKELDYDQINGIFIGFGKGRSQLLDPPHAVPPVEEKQPPAA